MAARPAPGVYGLVVARLEPGLEGVPRLELPAVVSLEEERDVFTSGRLLPLPLLLLPVVLPSLLEVRGMRRVEEEAGVVVLAASLLDDEAAAEVVGRVEVLDAVRDSPLRVEVPVRDDFVRPRRLLDEEAPAPPPAPEP